jgi:hypothetical protein
VPYPACSPPCSRQADRFEPSHAPSCAAGRSRSTATALLQGCDTFETSQGVRSAAVSSPGLALLQGCRILPAAPPVAGRLTGSSRATRRAALQDAPGALQLQPYSQGVVAVSGRRGLFTRYRRMICNSAHLLQQRCQGGRRLERARLPPNQTYGAPVASAAGRHHSGMAFSCASQLVCVTLKHVLCDAFVRSSVLITCKAVTDIRFFPRHYLIICRCSVAQTRQWRQYATTFVQWQPQCLHTVQCSVDSHQLFNECMQTGSEPAMDLLGFVSDTTKSAD